MTLQHLSLEQCKKLKELGFPQNTTFVYVDGEGYVNSLQLLGNLGKYTRNIVCATPTLEELLSWLGNDFDRVAFTHNINGEYVAYQRGINDPPAIFGNTPLEAIYNLAVAIKSKQPEV